MHHHRFPEPSSDVKFPPFVLAASSLEASMGIDDNNTAGLIYDLR